MATNLTSTPQKNLGFPDSGGMTPEMMNVLQNKGKPNSSPNVEKAKQQLKQLIAQGKVDPKILIQFGKMAEVSLKDPTMYQMTVQMAIKSGIIKPENILPGKDYKALGMAITAGKLAEMIVAEGV